MNPLFVVSEGKNTDCFVSHKKTTKIIATWIDVKIMFAVPLAFYSTSIFGAASANKLA